MNKRQQHKTLTLFFVFIVLVVVSFKPLVIQVGEWYIGDILKEEVHINSLDLYPTKLDAYIRNPKNRISIRVKEEFPLQAEVIYDGNMNAFKKYIDLDANTSLNASVVYDKELVIDTEANLIIPGFDTLHLSSKLNMYDENLSVSLEVAFEKNSEYDFDANVNKEGNTTLVSLQSDVFGGDTQAVYEENKLKLSIQNIHLSKLLKQYKLDVKARGYISAEAVVDTKTFKSILHISSPKIEYEKEILNNVVFDIKEFSYEKNKLKLEYILSLEYIEKNLLFKGDVDIKDVLVFLKQVPYAVEKFDLNTDDKLDELGIVVKSDKLFLNKNLTNLDDSLSLDIKARYTPKQLTFQTKTQAKTFQFNKSEGVYNLVKKELHLKQNFKLLDETKYIPLFIDLLYADEALKVKGSVFGGKLDLKLKNNRVNIVMKELLVDKVAKMTNKQVYVKGGVINGRVFYDLEKKRATINIRVKKMSFKGIDLDKILGAMELNAFNIITNFLNNDVNKVTKINHLEVDLNYKNEMIHLNDVAFATPKYRIAAIGDIHQDGNIKSLNIHILDKNGCSSITQKLTGSIYDIKLENKLSTIVDVVNFIPHSLVGQTKNILDFTSDTVDSTATLLVHESHLIENNISLISKRSDRIGARVIVNSKCKPIYSGLVKDPLKD
ncbi:MAG: hypothetical protein DSZ04_01215 [Sulfurimonas sp.]|nr:MAG: hypothetical protein DSZ04_01215 [Sulfurimonas sp.]